MKIKSWDITLRDVPGTTLNGRLGAFDGNTVQATENDEFYTTDTEAFLIFNLLDEDFHPTSATITLHNRTDGSVVNEDVDVIDGTIAYEMREEVIEHAGGWQAQLVYEQDKGGVPEKYTSKVVGFNVAGHLLDTKEPALVVIENWDNFVLTAEGTMERWKSLEAVRQENENQRVAAETARQEAYDDLIDTGVMQENINQKLAESEAEYAPRLTSLEQNDADLTTQLAQKVGNGVLANMGDLSQEVKEGMTGGSVAVVGEGAVTMPTLANDVKTKLENTDGIYRNPNAKNLFDPNSLIKGQGVRGNQGTVVSNTKYNMTPKYKVAGGEVISISGLEFIVDLAHGYMNTVSFWGGENSETHMGYVSFASLEFTDYLTFEIPADVTAFTLNVNNPTIPSRLQIEKSNFPTSFEPYYKLDFGLIDGELEDRIYVRSKKNIYDGRIVPFQRLNNRTPPIIQKTSSENNAVAPFIPVSQGKYYTISGLNTEISLHQKFILGSKNNLSVGNTHKLLLDNINSNTVTIYINDEDINYISIQLTTDIGGNKYSDAVNNRLQVEEGQVATPYEAPYYIDYVEKELRVRDELQEKFLDEINSLKDNGVGSEPEDTHIGEFVELNKTRAPISKVAPISKTVSPYGVTYELMGESNNESDTNNLYSRYVASRDESKEVYVHLANVGSGDNTSIGKLNPIPFEVPSGQLANSNSLVGNDYMTDDYCHPDIAYSEQGVAGYKYWMISSILPAFRDGKARWEDEDVFVSNDAINWLRIKSPYEEAKSYTAPNLSLPKHSLETESNRKHGFLPIPAGGDTIEVSVPADNGMPELDRVNITLSELPWKHDPAIFIDNGYVYTYHTFHLRYDDRPSHYNRFMVCVRTNDGINWEAVRTDGSTMVINEETSRQLFTKDNQGRYNYINYAYKRGYDNPKILKYGENDYELVTGHNFNTRFKGTTPYDFDMSVSYDFENVWSTNHPALLLKGDTLYLLSNDKMYVSTDRGETLTPYNHYPAWLGGVEGMAYKKSLCIGENGKVVLASIERQVMPASKKANVGGRTITNTTHQLFIEIYDSISDFVDKAENGIVDGYIDLQITKVNHEKGLRESRLYPYISNVSQFSVYNNSLQKIKVSNVELEKGDVLYFYVTLNSRNGARIRFGGIDIE